MDRRRQDEGVGQLVQVSAGTATLEGNLAIPEGAEGIVVFAHGSGSSRFSPRNRFVASHLNEGGLATLLFDLLTPEEDRVDRVTRQHRFDIELLAKRMVGATEWVRGYPDTQALNVGYFGSSTGAAAALVAAAAKPEAVDAVVSRGGRPDLAGSALPHVEAPTLLIVGGNDTVVIGMNRDAMSKMSAEKKLEIVPNAGHLFEEPGALEQVAELARSWFQDKLTTAGA